MAARKTIKETKVTEENVTTEETIASEETVAAEETIATEEAVAAEDTAGEESDGMITAKVIRIFRDKETQKIHRAGETLKITEERYQEIMKAGKYLRKV